MENTATTCATCPNIASSDVRTPDGSPMCGQCYNAQADAYRIARKAELAARRAERKANPPAPRRLYGDFAMLASLNGISTDGTGRKAAR